MHRFSSEQGKKFLDASICPLCGEPNQCALAADPNATECWCESVDFPEGLLAQIPDEAVRKTCVCQTCLRNYRESIGVSDDPRNTEGGKS